MLTRKNFLKLTAGTAFASSLTATTAAAAPAGPASTRRVRSTS